MMSNPRKRLSWPRADQGSPILTSDGRFTKTLPCKMQSDAGGHVLENDDSNSQASLPASGSDDEDEDEDEEEAVLGSVTIYGKKPENSTSAATCTAEAPTRVVPNIGECRYDTATQRSYGNKTLDARSVTNELGTVLRVWKFKDWKEVVQAVADVLEALDGLERAGRRHGNVSIGNVMILNGRGSLIDWDASRNPREMNHENKARLPDPTGTWQFMSARRLLDVCVHHDAADNIESVYWVLLWLTLNYSRHQLSSRKLRNHLQQVFDSYALDYDGFATGGHYKHALLRSDELDDYFHFAPQPPCLGEVLSYLHHQVGLRYYPPKKPYVASKSPEAREQKQKQYEEALKIYEAEKALSEDAMYIHSLLPPVLEEEVWPTYGPVSHPLPPVHDGPQIRERSKNRSSFFRAQEIARVEHGDEDEEDEEDGGGDDGDEDEDEREQMRNV
ncbi:hypothetical protein EVG20_g5346 [Dentipellis fragilis]|uniref:Fungal-type protein kinase domain-containing protein n=1 Tax=Dentipellis fragilis TaxID=205917 RepID=A0A4Y9YT57_9AGAM|nr:hypothetical protein EVG20_g5346 [Dentipellis fragilis]